MKISHSMLCAAALVALLFCSAPGFAQTQPDNTAQNKDHSVTADSQGHDKADRMTTKNIRKAVIADKGLSTDAHNIKIITANGVVTLKGVVRSDDEKQKVEADATAAAGSATITNDLTVKPQ